MLSALVLYVDKVSFVVEDILKRPFQLYKSSKLKTLEISSRFLEFSDWT